MEGMVKKYQQKLRKVKDLMQRWDDLQSHFIALFSDANFIIGNLQVIVDVKHYGSLRALDGIQESVLRKHLDSLETTLLSISRKLEEFRGIVLSLERMVRDGGHLGSQISSYQFKQRVGIKPSPEDCLDALTRLYEMHNSEYILKASVVSALMKIAYKPSNDDLGALHQLLVDQPNIPKDEVQFIFDVIFSEEIC